MYKKNEKILRIFSLFSMFIFLFSICFAIYLMIEYKEQREFVDTISESTQKDSILFMTKRIRPGFFERYEQYNMLQFLDAQILIYGLILFFITGIPTLRKNFEDPGRLIRFTDKERFIINKIIKKLNKLNSISL